MKFTIPRWLPEKLRTLLGEVEALQERAIPWSSIYNKAWTAVDEMDPGAWLNDLYEEAEETFAVISSRGKLYKAAVTYDPDSGDVAVGEWMEVMPVFAPVARSQTHVIRSADGAVRWMSISASAALNRAGEIDARSLFDSFIAHAEETGEYPTRQFFHSGNLFRTGQCDFLARDENLLITSGLYDDTEIARREIAAREADPAFWGDSIGFRASEYELAAIGDDDVTVPVYTAGVLREISTLPEVEAAGWFTFSTLHPPQENRMLETRQYEAFVQLFGGDKTAADAWLEANSATRNRAITEQGMITRDAPAPEQDTPETPEIVFDDNMMATLVDMVVAHPSFMQHFNLTDVTQALDQVRQSVQALATNQAESLEGLAQMTRRLEVLETDEEEKRNIIEADMPRQMRYYVTYRPRVPAIQQSTAVQPKHRAKPQQRDARPYSDLAAETLANMPESKH